MRLFINLLRRIYGSVTSGGNLTLISTRHATKGNIYFGAAEESYYDEVSNALRIIHDAILASSTTGIATFQGVDPYAQTLVCQSPEGSYTGGIALTFKAFGPTGEAARFGAYFTNDSLDYLFVWDPSGNPLFRVYRTGGIQIGSGATVKGHLSASASLNFPSISANSHQDLTVTVTGAVTGGTNIAVASPDGLLESGLVPYAAITAANTVTIRLRNLTGSAIDPAARTWRVSVFQY